MKLIKSRCLPYSLAILTANTITPTLIFTSNKLFQIKRRFHVDDDRMLKKKTQLPVLRKNPLRVNESKSKRNSSGKE